MRKFLLSLLAMFAVVATSSAADITDVLNQSVTGITGSSYTSFSGITVTSKAVYAGQCAGSYSSIQLRSNNSNSGIVTTASGGTITKVEVTWNSNTSANRTLQVYVSNTAFEDPTELYGGDATLAGTIVNDGSSTTLEIDGTYAYVGIRSASGAMYLDEVKFTWNDGQNVDTEAPEAPVITPEAGIYYGPTDVTITAEEGTEIYYTLNGGEETLYVAPFTLSETTKVEAVAKKGEHVSAKTSATFTIATVYTSLDDINRNTVDGNTPMKLVFDDLLVAYVNGSNTYVTDGEVGLLLFGTTDLTAGDRIKGSLTGTATLYNGLPEVKTSAAEIDAEVLSSDNAVAPKVVAADALKADMLGFVSQYVTLKGAKFAESQEVSTKINVPFTVGENEFFIRNNFLVEFAVDAEKEYKVSGFVTIYKENIQLYPIKAEDIAEKLPVVLSELANPSFDEGVTYGVDATDNLATSGSANNAEITGWTSNGGAAWSVGASFAYGTQAQLNSSAIPAEGPSTAALGVSVGWGGTVSYSQPVSLPAGYYVMSYKALNIFDAATQLQSRCGVIGGGNSFTSEKNSFASNVWESDFITFDLADDVEEARLQIGGSAISGGSTANAKVLFDDVELKLFDTAEERDAYVAQAKAAADLATAIGKATILKENTITGEELFMKPSSAAEELGKAIEAAQAVADNAEATTEEMEAAIEALATAVAAFNAAPVVQPEADAKYTFRLSLETEPPYYLYLDTETNTANVSQETLSEFSFVPTEVEGQYLLKTDDDAYLGHTPNGNDVWSMNATDQTPWMFTRLANGTYTIDKVTNTNQHVGAEANVESNSRVWADKLAGRAESQWFIEKVKSILVAPAFNIAPESEVEEGTELTVTFTADDLGDLAAEDLTVNYAANIVKTDEEGNGDTQYIRGTAKLDEATAIEYEFVAGFMYEVALNEITLTNAAGEQVGEQNPDVSAETSFIVVAKPEDPAQDVLDVMAKYPQVVSALVPDFSAWEGGLVSNNGQHWDGTSSSVYYEQTGAQWGQSAWENSSSVNLTLPAGKYLILVPGRSSASENVEAYMMVGEEKVVFPAKGDVGFGIATDGTPTFAEDATYANNGLGRGWEYRYVEFESDGTTPVTVTLGGSATAEHQWMSFTQPILRTTEDNTAVAKELLQQALDEANALLDNAGDGPFQKSEDDTNAFQGAIDAAQGVYDNASATNDEVTKATEDLKAATEAYKNAAVDVDETKYWKLRNALNADPAYYMVLDAEYQYVYVSQEEEPTPLHFVKTENEGEYLLVSEDGLYVGWPASDPWTMRTSAATAWKFTQMPNGAYTIDKVSNPAHHVGIEKDAELNKEGLPLCWADKAASRPESQWFFEPTEVVVGINEIGTANISREDVYTINGMKVKADARLQKGIYIVGGKKIVVK